MPPGSDVQRASRPDATSPPISGSREEQNSSGGKVKLGGISKRGDACPRKLLANGAMAVITGKHAKTNPWLVRLLASRPRMVVAVALANKMARTAWAVTVRRTNFRSATAAA